VGEVEPIPTFPAFVTMKFVAVEEPMTNEFPFPAIGLMASFAQGEVVAMPTFPPEVAR
jgi:hypothetical protein